MRRRTTILNPRALARSRRGSTIVEFALASLLYATFVFGIVEFAWISTNRQLLLIGAARGARKAAVGQPLSNIKAEVRSGSGLNVADGNIVIETNSNDAGSGTWSTATDDYTTGNPPLANAVASGRPIRVRVLGYPYQLLTGAIFSWLPGAGGGTLSMSAHCTTRRE